MPRWPVERTSRSDEKRREDRKTYSREWQRSEYRKKYRDDYNFREENKTRARFRMRARLGIKDATGENRFGICPICERYAQLCCDHNHKTGEVRGWPCRSCNLTMGRLKDSVRLLLRMVRYLLGRLS